MTFDNRIGKTLEKISPHQDTITRLLYAAERNIADYSGDIIPESAVAACIIEAEKLLKTFKAWLNLHSKT